MAKIVNHPHWNDDVWDSPSESAQQSPDKLKHDDISISDPGGYKPDTRTEEQKQADAGSFAVDGFQGSGPLNDQAKKIQELSKQVHDNQTNISDINTNKLPKVQEDVSKVAEQGKKTAEKVEKKLDDEIKNLLHIIPDGYISVYCDRDVHAGLDLSKLLSKNRRLYPFNQHFGASQGARLEADKRRVVFDKPGTWLITGRLTASGRHPGGNLGGDALIWADLMTYRQDDTLRETRTTRGDGSLSNTINFAEVVVVPQAGYSVRVWVQAHQWRSWHGGLQWNNLTALLLSKDIGNNNIMSGKDETRDQRDKDIDYQKGIEGG